MSEWVLFVVKKVKAYLRPEKLVAKRRKDAGQQFAEDLARGLWNTPVDLDNWPQLRPALRCRHCLHDTRGGKFCETCGCDRNSTPDTGRISTKSAKHMALEQLAEIAVDSKDPNYRAIHFHD